MHLPHFRSVRNSISHWYIVFLVGLVFIGIALLVFLRPAESLLALATLIGIGFVFAGIIEILFSLANRHEIHNWGWPLAFGVLTALVGIFFLTHPDFSVMAMTLSLGFLVLFRSIASISFSLELKHYGAKDWWVMILLGALGIFCAFALLMSHMLAATTLVLWAGLSLLAAGVYNIVLALRLRRLKGISSRLSEELLAKYHQIQHEIQEELHKYEHQSR